VTFETTEHFNLQTARAATISDADGRASIHHDHARDAYAPDAIDRASIFAPPAPAAEAT
jgi:hypothetical protein